MCIFVLDSFASDELTLPEPKAQLANQSLDLNSLISMSINRVRTILGKDKANAILLL